MALYCALMKDQISFITSFIQKTLKQTNKAKLVIAVSGGIDSAVALTLATLAIGKENVYPLLLPYDDQNILDGMDICRFNQTPVDNIQIFNIQKLVSNFAYDLKIPDSDKIRKGNIMARVRMIVIYDHAKKLDALVCGTENKSEKYLGYFTRFGDEASDLEPIQHLYKTQVWQLAKTLGIPEKFITKKPSAELWAGQSDENELGFSYFDGDKILIELIDKKTRPEAIKISGISKDIIGKIIKQVQSQHFKQEAPYHL